MNDRVVLNVCAMVFCVITPLFVIGRFACRKANLSIGSDDWTILAAMISTLIVNALHIVAIDHSLGKTNEETPPEDLGIKLTTLFVAQIFYKMAMSLLKVSICLLYLRIFINKYLRFGVWLTLIVAAGWGIGATIANIFQCRPLHKSWDPSVPADEGWCTDLRAVLYSSASVALATDVSLILLPIPLVYKMHRSLKEKILLYMIFGVGIIVTATTVVKLLSAELQAKNREKSRDLGASIWAQMEINLGVICACLPTLRAFVSRSLLNVIWRKGTLISSFFPSSSSRFTSDSDENTRSRLIAFERWMKGKSSSSSSSSTAAAGSSKNDIAPDNANSITKKIEISTRVLDEETVLDDFNSTERQQRRHHLNNATEHAAVPDGWLFGKESR